MFAKLSSLTWLNYKQAANITAYSKILVLDVHTDIQ